ncbi:MAG: hypothetical protein GY784_10785 [Gammaproteobacteria bacterium]|nr:hypothetical protein [Gammaproteobacteria bacterium]
MSTSNLSLTVVRQVFKHFDSVAVGAVSQGLLDAGVLERLATHSHGRLNLDDITRDHDLIPGYTRMAFDALAAEGFCRFDDGSQSSCRFELTETGQAWLAHRHVYREYDLRLGIDIPQDYISRHDRSCAYVMPAETDEIAAMVRTHLLAPAISFAMWQIAENGWQDFSNQQQHRGLLELIATEAWVVFERKAWQLTEAGQIALRLAQHYAYPVCYFPLLRQIPAMLAGRQVNEAAVDRALDVEFSGKVFDGPCRDLFLRQLLPIFDNTDISKQPGVIVDSGCGDATVLRESYNAIINQTCRGRYLADHPLLMVGVEYEMIAESAAASTLKAADIPHLIISGDIAKPDNIHQQLKKYDIDPGDILHISKSVIHDRTLIQPGPEKVVLMTQCPMPGSYHVTAAGQSVSAAVLFTNLVAFFQSWGQWISKHGMIAIESHCWPSTLCRAARGYYPMTLMKTTHGFSGQYLVTAEFYRKAAITAGLVALKSDSIESVAGLPPTMTIEHFIVHRR